ncbi:MAG: ATP-binding protein [Thermodesulfobacteriaceae bacterium]|nr:ATP-binding protein [Thermodesulfobacteriaceae bacterium]MCX8042342.1 ATP-binding protein [Thermodesulfobacteriaceae bacterium]MDW8136446.1 ATP-binding protein [Thermodesulfobacterium sp.]
MIIQKLKEVFKKQKLIIILLFVIFFLIYLEFNLFDISFLTLDQKNILIFFSIHINLILILILIYFIFRYLFKIFEELKLTKFSKSIRTKLVGTYLLSIIFPSLILILISFIFLKTSFDYWFKEFLEDYITSKIIKTEGYYKEIERELLNKGYIISNEYISKTEVIRSKDLREKYRYFMGLDSIEVYTLEGKLYKKTYSSEISEKLGVPPSILDSIIKEKIPKSYTSIVESKSLIRVFIPVKSLNNTEYILATGKFVDLSSIEGKNMFIESNLLQYLKWFLILSAVIIFLLIIFIGIWVGTKIGKNLTEPIQKLIGATQRISQKDYKLNDIEDYKISEDEVGRLIISFKEMVKKIQEYEEALKKYNEYLKSIIDYLPVGIFLLNEKFEISYFNESMKKYLKSFKIENMEKFLQKLIEALGGKENFLNFVFALSQNPFYKVVELQDLDNKMTVGITFLEISFLQEKGYMLIVENLEEREKIEKLSMWKEMALRVAHEIKNPLTPVKLSVQRLRKKLLDKLNSEEDKEILLKTTNIIENYIEELKNLVTDFYYFSKIPVLKLEKSSLIKNIEEVINLYKLAYPQIKFLLEYEKEYEIFLDSFYLKRVWINLLDNAIKSMNSEGQIKIKIYHLDNLVKVEFIDEGEGLPLEVKERLLKGNISELKGVGTGLFIVYTVLKLHKGSLEIRENFPQGTIFILNFPLN